MSSLWPWIATGSWMSPSRGCSSLVLTVWRDPPVCQLVIRGDGVTVLKHSHCPVLGGGTLNRLNR